MKMAGYGLGTAALTTLMEQFTVAHALAGPNGGYKALVCVFLAGGNDCNQTLIPLGDASDPTGGYPAYYNARNSHNLAIAQSNLLPISTSYGQYGLHPSLTNFQNYFNQRQLAITCNVGPLVTYLSRATYRGNGAKPFQLFSHSDQVLIWQTSRGDIRAQSGWGGRIADLYPPSSYPMVTSVTGSSLPIYTIGVNRRPLGIAPHPTTLRNVLNLTGFGTTAMETARRTAMDQLRTIDRLNTVVGASMDVTSQALQVSSILNVDDPTFQTVFPNTTLANQLRQVAKIMAVNVNTGFSLGNKQMFFCQLGGFDTHQAQNVNQPPLLTQVNNALKAFYDATVEIGVNSGVVTFTISDFGRTLNPGGSGQNVVGSDHAWGSHHFVLGDPVQGGDLFGRPMPASDGGNGTVYPTLTTGGPYDTDTRGRWIPTVSVEQYAATLAQWYGVSQTDLNTVFPLLNRFDGPLTFLPAG
jgi:uncharacterized protein (DUF1501 family)